MISIDNSVEVMIKTYLSLPTRITGVKGLSKNQFEKMSRNFSSLLDLLEQYDSEKIIGVELGEVEWFHRLRNTLYHEGNGITVEKYAVESYAAIAKILFYNLFKIDIDGFMASQLNSSKPVIKVKTQHKTQLQGRESVKIETADFIMLWASLENEIYRIAKNHELNINNKTTPGNLIKQLSNANIIPNNLLEQLFYLIDLRNQIVAHGSVEKIPHWEIDKIKNSIIFLNKIE